MRPRAPLAAPLAAFLTIAIAGCSTQPAQTTRSTASATAPLATGSASAPAPTTSATLAASAAPVDLDHLAVRLEPFTHVGDSPLDMVAPDDGTGRLFIVGQDGRIWVADANGTVHRDPIVDLRDRL